MIKQVLILVAFVITLSDASAKADLEVIELSMNTPRAAHSTTKLLDGRVLLVGGMSKSLNGASSSVEVYLPNSKKFDVIADLPIQIQSHSATLLTDGKVLITGGHDGKKVLGMAFLFDPETNQFSQQGRLKVARMSHRVVLLSNGFVLISGGTGSNGETLASAEIYEPETGRFRQLKHNMKKPRSSHELVLLNDGKVVIIGGHQGRGQSLKVHQTLELFNPIGESFEMVGEMLRPRHKFAAQKLTDGRVVILAGANKNDWRGRTKMSELYDPILNKFSPTASMHSLRYKHSDAVVLLNNGKVLLLGGANVPELYDSVDNSFEPLAIDLGGGYAFMSASRLDDGSVLGTGGYDQRGEISEKAWLFFQKENSE